MLQGAGGRLVMPARAPLRALCMAGAVWNVERLVYLVVPTRSVLHKKVQHDSLFTRYLVFPEKERGGVTGNGPLASPGYNGVTGNGGVTAVRPRRDVFGVTEGVFGVSGGGPRRAATLPACGYLTLHYYSIYC